METAFERMVAAGDLPPEATVDAHGVLEGELPLELGALIDEGREAARR
jgi:hypothetical protein